MKNFIAQLLLGAPQKAAGDAAEPSPKSRARKDWRDRAVQKAAARYGKPFKCAPDGVPREVLLGNCAERVIELRCTPRTAKVSQFPKSAAGAAGALKAV